MRARRPDRDSGRSGQVRASTAPTNRSDRANHPVVPALSECNPNGEPLGETLAEYGSRLTAQCAVDPVLLALMAELRVADRRRDRAGYVEVKRLLRFINRWQRPKRLAATLGGAR